MGVKKNMKKETILFLGILIFSLILLSFVSAITIYVPQNFSTIQEAINNASDGDIILVDDGTYNEQLTINKSLNVSSVNGASLAIIDLGQPSETTGIWILANNTIFNGFTVRNISTVSGNAQYALRIRGKNNKISNNIIIGQSSRDWWSDEEDSAINLDGTASTITSGNIIENNEIYDFSAMGVQIVGSGGNFNAYNNIIRKNNIHDIQYYAIANDRSANQTITNNSLTDIGPSGHVGDGLPAVGVIVWSKRSAGTKIISQNASGTEIGIVLSSAQNIKVERCEVINNSLRGIQISYTGWIGDIPDNNTITNCTISQNSEGVFVRPSTGSVGENNKINWNNIYGNTIGINNTADENINATFNYWGSCDGPSGESPGSGDSVYGNISYNPWLGACPQNKSIDSSCVLATDNVTLKVNVTSLICVGDVWFGINTNNIWKNYTYTSKSGSSYFFILNSSLLFPSQFVNWTVYADDCYNHTSRNGIESFYVNRRTNLSVVPINPDGLNGWYVTEPLFTLTNPDAANLFYMWDSSGIINYTAPFGLENIPNPPEESAGILELNYWSNFSCNRTEQEQSQIFKIDLVTPSIINLIPFGMIYNNFKPTIQAYLEELYGSNSGIDKTSVVMRLDDSVVATNVFDADGLDALVRHNPSSDLALGKHNVSVNVTDKAGRKNYTFWEFEINTTLIFDLQIFSPENKDYNNPYGNKKVKINISIVNNSGNVELSYIDWQDKKPDWKVLCRDCDEYGNSREKTKNFNDGFHNLTFKGEDDFGNIKEKNINFFVDSKEPKISKTLPGKNKVTNGSNFYIKYTEDNLKEVSVNWNPVQVLASCNESGKNKECFVDLNLSAYDGSWIEYYFNVSDYVRSVISKETRVKVDVTFPILNVNLPENKTGNESYGRKVPFNITISEEVLLEYIDLQDASPRWRRLCSNCDEYGNSREKTKSFKRGAHDLLIRAVDEAGNSDIEEKSFEVDF